MAPNQSWPAISYGQKQIFFWISSPLYPLDNVRKGLEVERVRDFQFWSVAL